MERDERAEAQMARYHAVGHAAEAEQLAEEFFKRAGARFAAGKDGEARLLRGLAKEMEGRGRKHRQRQKEAEARIASLASPDTGADHDD